jgi:ABC-type Na+ transport system ATPase subunit NatA
MKQAVDDLSLDVAASQVTALLGETARIASMLASV